MKNKDVYKVGVQYLDAYPEKRNIVGVLPNSEYVFVEDNFRKSWNFKAKLRRYTKFKKVLGRLISQNDTDRYSFNLSKRNNQIDILHFFNTVNLNAKQPWGVTFEATLPHFPPFSDFHKGDFKGGNKKAILKIEKYLKALADDQCKFIIAISQCNLDIQKAILSFYPRYEKQIKSKLKLLHPPQDVLVSNEDIIQKQNTEVVKFMFIGNDFTRKGGVEILHVFTEIEKTHKNFQLEIIGDFKPDCFYSSNLTAEEKGKIQKFFKTKQERIIFHDFIENKVLMEKLRTEIHVGLLPTRSETYGYSVLEFQANGCPVITTDIRALTEINNENCGWLLPIKQNSFKESYHFEVQDLNEVQVEIEKRLKKVVLNILNDPSVILKKAMNSVERIKNNHSVINFEEETRKIYNSIDKQ